MDAIVGFHAVTAALEERPERIKSVLLNNERHDKRLSALLEQARDLGVRFERLDGRQFQQRARKLEVDGLRHQGVIALVHALAPLDENQLWPLLEQHESPLLLILDGVTDPHNLGACLRTADAAGVAAVIVPRNRSAGLTTTVVKVASGAAEQVPLVQVTNLARTMKALQERGIWITGTTGDTDQFLHQANLTGPAALVMGAEGEGMRRLTREHCDHLVKIPMLGSVSSLNVSVATGVCLYEALRQRRA